MVKTLSQRGIRHYSRIHLATHNTVNVPKKYSAIGNSAIGNCIVLCSKLILKTVLLEVSYGKND